MTRGMHRWMGTRTRDATNVSRWMQLKSRGGAIMPSPELLRFIEGAEKVFKEVHGLELDLQYNPIQRVIDILRRQRPEMDPLIIQAYSRARFFFAAERSQQKAWCHREGQNEKRHGTQGKIYVNNYFVTIYYYCYIEC